MVFFWDSKLGVPIKTTVSATVLEEALNGRVSVSPLTLGQPLFRKVKFKCMSIISLLDFLKNGLFNSNLVYR